MFKLLYSQHLPSFWSLEKLPFIYTFSFNSLTFCSVFFLFLSGTQKILSSLKRVYRNFKLDVSLFLSYFFKLNYIIFLFFKERLALNGWEPFVICSWFYFHVCESVNKILDFTSNKSIAMKIVFLNGFKKYYIWWIYI